MNNGLIERLREHGTDLTVEYARCVPKRLLNEAAHEIDRLEGVIAERDAMLLDARNALDGFNYPTEWIDAALAPEESNHD